MVTRLRCVCFTMIPMKNSSGNIKVAFTPTQVYLDASGKEVFRHTGVSTEYELVSKLQKLNLIKTP